MGFMRKFKDFMGVPEDEYMDDEEDMDYDKDFDDEDDEIGRASCRERV